MHKRIILMACLACGANGHRAQLLEKREGSASEAHQSPQQGLDALSRQARGLHPLRVLAVLLGVSSDLGAAFVVPSPELASAAVTMPMAATDVSTQARALPHRQSHGALEGLVFPSEANLPTFQLLSSETLSTVGAAGKSVADVLAEASAITSASVVESRAVLEKAKAESEAIRRAAQQKRTAVLSEAETKAASINNGADKKVADAFSALRQARTKYNRLEGKISYLRRIEREYKEERLDAFFNFFKGREMEEQEKRMQREQAVFFKDTEKAERVLQDAEKEYDKLKEASQGQIDAAKKVIADASNQANSITDDAERRSKQVLRDGEQASKDVLKAGETKVAALKSLLEAQATAAK